MAGKKASGLAIFGGIMLIVLGLTVYEWAGALTFYIYSDTTPPWLEDPTAPAGKTAETATTMGAPGSGTYTVKVWAGDSISGAAGTTVWMSVLHPDGYTQSPLYLTLDPKYQQDHDGEYYYNWTIPNKTGVFKFTFYARDQAGNTATPIDRYGTTSLTPPTSEWYIDGQKVVPGGSMTTRKVQVKISAQILTNVGQVTSVYYKKTDPRGSVTYHGMIMRSGTTDWYDEYIDFDAGDGRYTIDGYVKWTGGEVHALSIASGLNIPETQPMRRDLQYALVGIGLVMVAGGAYFYRKS